MFHLTLNICCYIALEIWTSPVEFGNEQSRKIPVSLHREKLITSCWTDYPRKPAIWNDNLKYPSSRLLHLTGSITRPQTLFS